MTEDKEARFKAYFPPIASAILVSGNQDGMQIKLNIPESEIAEAICVQLWRGKMLEVTIKVCDDPNQKSDQQPNQESNQEEQAGGESAKTNSPRRRSAKQRV